jgi:hypothetical protein
LVAVRIIADHYKTALGPRIYGAAEGIRFQT